MFDEPVVASFGRAHLHINRQTLLLAAPPQPHGKTTLENIVDYNVYLNVYLSTWRTKTFTVRRLDVRYSGGGSLLTYTRIAQVPT